MAHLVQLGHRHDQFAIDIGPGLWLQVNEVSATAAIQQLALRGRLTLPNTVDLGDALDAMDAEKRRP